MKDLRLIPFIFLVGFFSYQGIGQTRDADRVLLAWDASFSMENRVPEHDFKFLDNYFKRNPEVHLDLVIFSNEVDDTLEFSIEGGNWEALKNRLEGVTYDGATNYKAVEALISLNHRELLLFTDGAQNFGPEIPVFGIKTFLINSNPFKEQMDLNALLVKNGARLFDYGRPIFTENTPVNAIKKVGPSETESVKGVDSLTGGIKLKEVVVSKNREPAPPSEVVDIGNGEVDKNRIGVATQSIGDDEITPIQTNVARSVQNRFSGVQLGSSDDLSKVTMRTNTSMVLNNYGLVVVDGVPQQQSASSAGSASPSANFNYLDPENIADITVLKGMAATTRFGTAGANGVILITTKSARAGTAGPGKPEDRALVKENIYTGRISENSTVQIPGYLQELRKCSSREEAYTYYLDQRFRHLEEPAFFINAFHYFESLDKGMAQRVLSNIAELSYKNIPGLRILAYTYDTEGQSAYAYKIYRQILALDENSGQALYDMALASQENRNYPQAHDLLSRLLANNTPQLTDYSGLAQPAGNSMRDLLHTTGNNIQPTAADSKYRNVVHYDARVLVMWNKSNAQFELKFINPDKRFFSWEHSKWSDERRYSSDVSNDANSEEFHLIDAQKGNWYIEVTNLNAYTGAEPVYLKCIVYYHFGLPDQRKVIKTMELSGDAAKEGFFKISM